MMSSTRIERLTMKMNATHVGGTGGEYLIWCTRMKREEYNLNQRTRQLDICEAHLCVRECRCHRHEAEIHAARMRGRDIGSESGSE
jgi:hypothetical protein